MMQCKNCGQHGGLKGNKHVKNRKYTCKRLNSSGTDYLPNIIVDSAILDSGSNSTDYGGYSGDNTSIGYSSGE